MGSGAPVPAAVWLVKLCMTTRPLYTLPFSRSCLSGASCHLRASALQGIQQRRKGNGCSSTNRDGPASLKFFRIFSIHIVIISQALTDYSGTQKCHLNSQRATAPAVFHGIPPFPSATSFLTPMFCPFSQNVLLQLSCTGFRKLVHDLDFAWDHELANVALVLCPRYEVFRLEALAFLDCHVGLWTFTPGFESRRRQPPEDRDAERACPRGLQMRCFHRLSTTQYDNLETVLNRTCSPEMMMSLARSRICAAPSSCITARSPECKKPPAKSFLVASGSL